MVDDEDGGWKSGSSQGKLLGFGATLLPLLQMERSFFLTIFLSISKNKKKRMEQRKLALVKLIFHW